MLNVTVQHFSDLEDLLSLVSQKSGVAVAGLLREEGDLQAIARSLVALLLIQQAQLAELQAIQKLLSTFQPVRGVFALGTPDVRQSLSKGETTQ
jgi:hypothetical protein